MERTESSLALLAIFVSRFEASTVASMLRGYGLHVIVDGEAHASVEYISLALGGHRLLVMPEDYEVASEILRQCGVEDDDWVPNKPTRALVWLVSTLAGLYSLIAGVGIVLGSSPILTLISLPLAVYAVPVDPKGRPDYFLAPVTG